MRAASPFLPMRSKVRIETGLPLSICGSYLSVYTLDDIDSRSGDKSYHTLVLKINICK
jgi:hypothetical protein